MDKLKACEFKKWWNKQNNLTLRMAGPETIAKAAWNARAYPEDVVELAKKIKMRGDCKLEFDPKLMTAGIKLASLILQGESK